jgi:hypothetical protein
VREIEGLIISILAKETPGNFNADIELVKNIHHSMVNNDLYTKQPIIVTYR